MLKKLFKNKILLVLLVFVLWLVPVTISIPDQSSTEVLITAIAVDKDSESGEYEVTLQYILPTAPNNSENLKTTSQKDESVHKAVEKLNFQLGKYSGIAHCRFIIFNKEVAKDNVTNILDPFLRQKTNSNNIVLLCAEDSAKDVLETSKNLDSNLYSFLNNTAFSNELRDFKELKTVGDYYEGYFGHNNSIKIFVLSTQDESGSGASSGGGSDGSSGSQSDSSSSDGKSSGGSSQKDILNEGKAVVIKGSKQVAELTSEQNNNVNLFSKNVKRGSFEIKNFSDEYFKGANIVFDIRNKVTQAKVYFKDGKPYYDLYLKLFLRTSEIAKEKLTEQDYEILQMQYSEKLIDEIKKVIVEKLKSAEAHFKENKYDIVFCEDKFYKFKTKEYKEFIKTLPQGIEFIEEVNFNYYVDVVKSG